jgi:hypothetical protein
MNKQLDDLDAVRTLIQTLEKFNTTDQERIIRWVQEKLGLSSTVKPLVVHIPSEKMTDIKAFVKAKNPITDRQFAATIAYYYRFEAPEDQRKDSITAKDLQDACKMTGRNRFKTPAQTLLNAHNAGLLDKASYGAYSLNTVGENLVAMTLPSSKTEVHQHKKSNKKK